MAQVFLSYAREDELIAYDIIRMLRQAGIDAFWDRDIDPGANFRSVIYRELLESDFVVVIFSQHSVQSEFVLDEAEIARSEDKLIPLRDGALPANKIPPGFGQKNSFSVVQLPSVIDYIKRRTIERNETRAQLAEEANRATREISGPGRQKLEDVFCTGRPGPTEVDRSQGRAFRLLKSDLLSRSKITCLHGQSKSGKTTFVRQVLKDRMVVRLHGSTISRVADFESRIAEKIGASDKDSNILALAEICGTASATIVIDDFHNIGKNTAVAIIKKTKAFLDENVTIVLISIPSLDSVLEQAHDEIHGRDAVHQMPAWSDDEIKLIALRGFAALNVEASSALIDTIARWSHRSPLMMQEHCNAVCAIGDIWEAAATKVPLNVQEGDIKEIFRKSGQRVAATFGKQLRKQGDNYLTLANGKDVTIFEALMLSICRLGITQPISTQTMGRRLRKLLSPESAQPTNSQVKDCLEALVDRTGKLKNASETIGLHDGFLHIFHPYFKQYLVWTLQAEHLEEMPPIRI